MSSLLRGSRAPRGGRNSKRGTRGKVAGAADSSTASSRSHGLRAAFHRNTKSSKRQNKGSNNYTADQVTTPIESDPYKADRLGNAAKRASLKGTTVNGEGKQNGQAAVDKQVRFALTRSQESRHPPTSRDSSSGGSYAEPHTRAHEFSTKPSGLTFTKSNGIFGASSNPPLTGQNNPKIMSPFGTPAISKFRSPGASVFGAPSAPSSFGSPSNGGSTNLVNSNPFSKPTPIQPPTNGFSVFGAPSNASTPTSFGSNPFSIPTQQVPKSPPKFGAPLSSATSNFAGGFRGQPKITSNASPFGGNGFVTQASTSTSPSLVSGTLKSTFATPMANGANFSSNQPKPPDGVPTKYFGMQNQAPIPNGIPTVPSSKWAMDMEKLLRKDGINAPSWPMKTPGDPSQKGAVESHWRNYREYRTKARACLIKNSFIDDPDKPKKLSEAIDFKGTCEEMCPEFEKITRIMESDVKGPEKEVQPGQTVSWPAPHKMIKALARSAAGQDAPLPEDVRSPAALRRTLDYLIDKILTEDGLPDVHGFLWDRTRAIRRDFTFQAQSMTTREELLDQVYCLEQITRFHVIALHQMSPRRLGEKITEDFSEQQELEQLGKALLSLTHAYEDCKGHNVKCENEAEFRSYYIVFNAHHSGIMEDIQNWGWEFWGESEQTRIAITIVEAIQNTWDTHGPLKPESAAVIAQNAYSKFFSIVQDPSISYAMACFAEIHFNMVRKSALKTIISSYRKQRDQTKEWTLSILNEILYFDDEEDMTRFCEAYLLTIQSSGDEEPYLSLEEDYKMEDPFPKLSQLHSYIVERKRGNRSLQDAIHQTIFEDVVDDDSMFVPQSRSRTESAKVTVSPVQAENPDFNWSHPILNQEVQKPAPPVNSPINFFVPLVTAGTSPSSQDTHQAPASSLPSFGDTIPKALQATSVPASNFIGNKLPEAKGFTFDFQKPSITAASTGVVSPAMPEPPASTSNIQNSFIAPQSLKLASTSLFPPRVPSEPAANALKLPSFNPIPPTIPAINPSPPAQSVSDFDQQHLAPTNASLQASIKENLSIKMSPPRPLIPAPPTPEPPLESHMPAFAEWFTYGVDGIISHFLEHEVERILRQTVAEYQREEEERQIKEEEDRVREQADAFRRRSLGIKYGYRWRENAHSLWMRRKAIESRNGRAERMKELKAAREAAKAFDRNIVAEFTKATKRKSLDDSSSANLQRRSSEDRLRATGILDFVHDPNKEIRNVVRADSAPRREERSESPLVLLPAPPDHKKAVSKNGHQRSKSQSHLRSSLLSDPSYLQGGSRAFLLPDNSPALYKSKMHNNVQTDYFRLQARGIFTLPNGSPVATSAAKHLLKQKRSFDGIVKNATPKRSIRQPEVRSVPAKRNHGLLGESDDELSQLKERAKGLINGKNESRALISNKRALDIDEEELFAKAKRIREQMDEGAEWFREEVRRESLTKSRGSGHGGS